MFKITQRDDTNDPITDQLVLPFDLRKRGRFKALTVAGKEVGIFIERGQVLHHGERLRTECGQVLEVAAEPERVFTAHTRDWLQFARVCYHFGNRHVPMQVGDRWLRFQPDHVLRELAERYGLSVAEEMAPFEPENGAYGDLGGGHAHGDHHH